MSRGFRSMIMGLSSSVALLGAGVALAAAPAPVARAAGNCGVGSGRGYGYTYLTTLSVRRTNCSTGKKVVKHHGHLRGWHCGKKRLGTSPTQYVERETCSNGSRQVKWTYSQNT